MKFWNELLTGKTFSDWLLEAIPSSKVYQGKKLDPFQTSMRNATAISEWLELINQGEDLEARGGSGKQNITDLRSAKLVELDKTELTELGRKVLSQWQLHEISNKNSSDDFLRMIILVGEALSTQNEFYESAFKFWGEIRQMGEPINYISNPESLYLCSFLNRTLSNFNPWEIIKSLKLTFSASNNIELLAKQFNSDKETSSVERLQSWLKDSATRATGRQKFCLAMELIYQGPDEIDLFLTNPGVLSILNEPINKDTLKEIIKNYYLQGIKSAADHRAENIIFYGAPGTGKSTTAISRIRGWKREVITFHPETDYSSFVGFYKPISEFNNDLARYEIIYKFVPQHFLRIYTEAWKNLENPYCLLIEEINRGNCAKIFGDIFQLLDREEDGFSRYFINNDSDISSYLKKTINSERYEKFIFQLFKLRNEQELDNPYSVMILPNNLSIYATMNTSDQSLFPMDTAFKRRWQWQFIPIDYSPKNIKLIINNIKFDWLDFVKKTNNKILKLTESEDKQIGTFFIKPNNDQINIEQFVNKVLFYLWNDVFKDEDPLDENNIFLRKGQDDSLIPITYSDFFSGQGLNIEIIISMLSYNSISFRE
ncbi:AAA family ATPase [Legionella pneumophila serogroup 1]